MQTLNHFRRAAIFCALSVMVLWLATGCVSSNQIANRLVSAPNLHGRFVPDSQCQWLVKGIFLKGDPFLRQEIPVGPPAATLSVMELPPANYHVKVETKATIGKDGKRWFQMWLRPDTNAVTTPLPQKGTIVMLHGYLTQKEVMLPWALILAQAGWRVVLVDLRGHGHSTGKTFYAGKVETTDMVQMLDYLAAHHLCDERVGVFGYSFGADLALYWAARDSRVRTVVAIAPFNKTDEAIVRLVKELKLPFSEQKVRVAATIAETKMGIQWADWSGETNIRKVTVPVFLIGGEKDAVSIPADMMILSKASPAGSKCLMIPEANHEVIGVWTHDLAKPVTAWFDEELSGQK